MNKIKLKTQVFYWDHWATSAVHLSTEGSLWSTQFSLFVPGHSRTFAKNRIALLSFDLYGKIANSIFTLLFFGLLSRERSSILLILFSRIFSYREKREHERLISNFWKNAFHPKIKTKRCSRSNFQIWPTGTIAKFVIFVPLKAGRGRVIREDSQNPVLRLKP